MGIKAAIRSILLNDVTINGAVGTRVSPVLSGTTAVLPRIVYARTGGDDSIHLLGVSSLRYDDFNFSVLANTADEADDISENIRVLFGSIINTTYEGVYVQRFNIGSISDVFEIVDGREKPVYEVLMSFRIAYHA